MGGLLSGGSSRDAVVRSQGQKSLNDGMKHLTPRMLATLMTLMMRNARCLKATIPRTNTDDYKKKHHD